MIRQIIVGQCRIDRIDGIAPRPSPAPSPSRSPAAAGHPPEHGHRPRQMAPGGECGESDRSHDEGGRNEPADFGGDLHRSAWAASVRRRLRVALLGKRGEYHLYEVAEVRDDRVTPLHRTQRLKVLALIPLSPQLYRPPPRAALTNAVFQRPLLRGLQHLDRNHLVAPHLYSLTCCRSAAASAPESSVKIRTILCALMGSHPPSGASAATALLLAYFK
jgi:hypothetical protein